MLKRSLDRLPTLKPKPNLGCGGLRLPVCPSAFFPLFGRLCHRHGFWGIPSPLHDERIVSRVEFFTHASLDGNGRIRFQTRPASKLGRVFPIFALKATSSERIAAPACSRSSGNWTRSKAISYCANARSACAPGTTRQSFRFQIRQVRDEAIASRARWPRTISAPRKQSPKSGATPGSP